VDAPGALGTEGSEDGCKLLLIVAANSEELRISIEKDEREPPTKLEGGKQDKVMLDRATEKDLVMPKDYRANGIVHLSNWPSSTAGTGRAAGPRQPGYSGNTQRNWDTDTNRNIVMNFKSTLEGAYRAAKGRNRNFLNFHNGFDSATERVRDVMKSQGKTCEDKVMARTVLYLFQKVATILW
jgi:hypothetical protein